MIDKADAEHGPNSRKIARRPQIFRTGRGITARMIMRNDHRRCIGGKSRGENPSQRPADAVLFARPRSEERRVGKEWVSTCRYRCAQNNYKKKEKTQHTTMH